MRPRHEVVVVEEEVVVEVVEGSRTSRGGLGEASPCFRDTSRERRH